jgi:hypothetical protein
MHAYYSDSDLSPITDDRTCSVAVALLWNLSGHDRTQLLQRSVVYCVASSLHWVVVVMLNSSSICASGAKDCVASGRYCWCLLLPSSWSAHPVLRRGTFGHLCQAYFFAILCPAWFLSSCLDFAWFLRSSILLLGSCLRCWSSDHHVTFVQVTFATYWNAKLTLTNMLVQFGLVDHQTPKSKVNGPRVHFPYNLPLFSDWWQHDQSKQIIKILQFQKTIYLLGCNAKARLYDAKRYHLWKT